MARRYRSRGYGTYDAGAEAARRHIEAARELSRELGGTDKDVKEYFFKLPQNKLDVILREYGRLYGSSAKSYAEQTMPKWRSGRTQMSGLVAERLFNLLPPRMPLSAKYQLTENLWEHFGPRSKKRLRIGLDAGVDEAVEAVRAHFDEVVLHYKIPDQLERRFNWLSAGDVSVKQELLNHLRSKERLLLSEGARMQLPMMLSHMRGDIAGRTSRMAQTLKIGNHELELLIDPKAQGVSLEEYVFERSGGSIADWDHWGLVFWIAIMVALYFWATS